MLAGIWERPGARRGVLASSDHYWCETVDGTMEADEFADRVEHIQHTSDHLTLLCTNPDLPGIAMVKEYWLKPGDVLAKRVSVSGHTGGQIPAARLLAQLFHPRLFAAGLF